MRAQRDDGTEAVDGDGPLYLNLNQHLPRAALT